jgi:hypothetical protein
MKHLILAGLLAVAASAQATDVGVSIGFSQPGVYGRVDIGRFPQPAVVVAQPVLVQQPRYVVAQPVEPVYLWVPPGHRKNWRHHCAQYNACGVPVMFVQDRWYNDHVRYERHPVYQERRGPERGFERGYDRGRDNGPPHGRGPDHDRGHGEGHDRRRD